MSTSHRGGNDRPTMPHSTAPDRTGAATTAAGLTYLHPDRLRLGLPRADGENLLFSARPAAGTQQIPLEWSRAVKAVPADTPVDLNRIER